MNLMQTKDYMNMITNDMKVLYVDSYTFHISLSTWYSLAHDGLKACHVH